MGDPYWRRYYPSTNTVDIPGYVPADPSTFLPRPSWPLSHYHGTSSTDYQQKDIVPSWPGAYGVNNVMGINVRPESSFSNYNAGPSSNGYPPVLEDPYVLGRRDGIHGTGPVIPDIVNNRPDVRESNVLFVDGLPSDCSRREVSHLFRPFLGFEKIRLVHKEPRHNTDNGLVLCFVEFLDSNHALTALKALQGYKFDNKKPDSSSLQIHFAHFPFQLPDDRVERRLVTPREEVLGVQDEEAVAVVMEKRKFEGSPGPSKKAKMEASKNKHALPKKRKKKCDKCNKKHLGDCSTKGCSRCGKPGQILRNCTAQAQPETRTCYSCGEVGHISPNCPKSKTNGSKLKKKGNANGALVKKEDPSET